MANVPLTDNIWHDVCTDVSKWPGAKSANPPWSFCVSIGIGVAIFHIHAPEWKYDIQVSKRFKIAVATLCCTDIWSENMIYLYTIGSKSLRRCYVSNIYERVKICKYDIQICKNCQGHCGVATFHTYIRVIIWYIDVQKLQSHSGVAMLHTYKSKYDI